MVIEQAVILAVGSSLHKTQLAYNRPRSMFPALGKPIVARTMERLYRAGLRNYIVIIGEDEGAVAAYLNNHWLPNVSTEFVLHSYHNNIAHTLSSIARKNSQPFLISAYNTFTHANFPEQLLKRYTDAPRDLTLAVAPNTLSKSPPYAYGKLKNRNISSIDHEELLAQPSYIIGGYAACGIDFVRFLGQFKPDTGLFNKQLVDVFRAYLQSGGRIATAETNWLLQIECDYDLLTLNLQLLDDGADAHILSELPPNVQIIPPVRVDPHVSVGHGARLGPYVYLEAGCSVGQHTQISNSLILQNAVISAHSVVQDAIIASRVRIDAPALN